MNLESLTMNVCELTRDVGAFIKQERYGLTKDMVHFKGVNNLVSTLDIEAEKLLIKGLNDILPDCDFLAEESTPDNNTDNLCWVIDPIDGTTNFVHGIPCYAISIALIKKTKVLSGVIYEINQNECFYAWDQSDAYLNGNKIQVHNNEELLQSLIATGFPYDSQMKLIPYIDIMKDIIKNTRGIRRLGSAAVDLAYVAAGRFDGFYEINLSPWDVAAGSLIVKCAGGDVCDFKGGNDFIFGKSIVAGNKTTKDYLLSLTKNY